jgi:hypothetical protein
METTSRDLLLVRISKMMNRNLLKKAERELKIAPLVRVKSHLLMERRIRSSLPLKMMVSNHLLREISKHSLKEKSV